MEQNSSQASCHATVRAKTSVSVNCQRYALLHKREPRMLRLDLLPCILRDSVMWTNGPCFRAAICLLFPHLKSRTLRRSQCSLNAIRTCFCNTWEHKLNMNSTSEDRQLRERGHCRRALVTFFLPWKSCNVFWLCVCSLSYPACKARGPYYTGSFKKIWTSSTVATEVTGPDTLWFFPMGIR